MEFVSIVESTHISWFEMEFKR